MVLLSSCLGDIMTIDEIFAEWDKDAEIPEYDLHVASLKTSKLHHKYYKILSAERQRKVHLEAKLNELKIIKTEYYSGTLDTKTLNERGYKPFQARLTGPQLQKYLDADQEISQQNIKISMAKEKVDILESIIKMIMTRNFHISNAINFIKFREGSN